MNIIGRNYLVGGQEHKGKIMKRISRAIISKITKKNCMEFLRYKLATDAKWNRRAIQRIFENQTISEQEVGTTVELNGVGFTGFDAKFMTSLVNSMAKYEGNLTPKQQRVAFKIMPKYARQILKLCNIEKLHVSMLKDEEWCHDNGIWS